MLSAHWTRPSPRADHRDPRWHRAAGPWSGPAPGARRPPDRPRQPLRRPRRRDRRRRSASTGVTGGSNDDAAAADLVIVTVPYEGHADLLTSLAEPLAGKIVVDCVNPLGFDAQGPYALAVADGSAAQEAQRILPDSTVVAAFHHVSAVRLEDPEMQRVRRGRARPGRGPGRGRRRSSSWPAAALPGRPRRLRRSAPQRPPGGGPDGQPDRGQPSLQDPRRPAHHGAPVSRTRTPSRRRRRPVTHPAAEADPAHRQRQGRHRQDHDRRRAGLRAGHRRAPGAGVRGRGPARHHRPVRPAAAGRRRGASADAARPTGGAVHGLAIDAEDALLEYLESFYHLGFAAQGPGQVRRRRLRHLDRARTAGRAADRQGVRGGAPPGQGPRRRVRRRRPGRPADRSDRPVPQHPRGRLRTGQGRPDPQPGRLDQRHAAGRRPPWCTWSRCWRTCR